MENRQQILNDRQFWERLEFVSSSWLTNSNDKNLRKYWIDGFLPDTFKNTRIGADITGLVWIGEGSRNQYQFRFIATIPQKILYHATSDFDIEELTMDYGHQMLTLKVAPSE